MKRKWMLVTALVMALLAGCSTSVPATLVQVADPAAVEFDDYEKQLAVRRENEPSQAFTESLEAFALKSGAALMADEEGNINYSPVSLYLALALTASGAGGETREQLLTVLEAKGMTVEELSGQCGKLYRRLYREDSIGHIRPAASLWLGKGMKLKDAFAKTAGEDFYAEVYSGDFRDERTTQVMGEWIRRHTSGQLIPEVELAQDTLMTLFTCLDFQDQWIDEFQKEDNRKADFTRADGSVITAEYMCREYNPYGYVRGDGFVRASLSLKSGNHMVFVLPDEGITATELASDPEKLREALTGGEESYARVIFEIPKYDFSSSCDLREEIAALGGEEVFGMGADLYGISGSQLYLSGIKQQTRIAVDEKGVSAAAFTEIQYAGAALMQQEEVRMILNRPFVYAVRNNDGTILFMGVCQMPTEA